MKAIWKPNLNIKGMIQGKTYDVEIDDLVVSVEGKDFKYTFSYSSMEKLEQEWLLI